MHLSWLEGCRTYLYLETIRSSIGVLQFWDLHCVYHIFPNHISIMATFQFNINLGSGLTFTSGIAQFYGLKDGTPVDLGSTTVNSTTFSSDLDNETYAFLYVVLTIQEYDAGNGSISVDGRTIQLLSIFKNNDPVVSIGERETIANTFCFSRFASINSEQVISVGASDRDMGIMSGLRDSFISVEGNLSDVISGSPNGMETNSYSMFNFLSNLIYYCITDPAVYKGFTELSSSSRAASASTFEAFIYVLYDPWKNVQEIYDLISTKTQVYRPSLPDMYTKEQQERWSPVPNQWTLSVKVNDSGAQNFVIAGPGYIAFDENDRAWITNNATQGSPNSGFFCVVFNSDGSPADFSPVFGGGLIGGGFGVTTNSDGSRVFLGNYGWGPKQYNPEKGSISVVDSDGTVRSPANGYVQGLSRVQGMMYDDKGNLWMTSWGSQEPMAPSNETIYDFPDVNSAVVVYLNFDGSKAPEDHEVLVYEFEEPSPYHGTFDVVFDKKGNAFVSNSGSAKKQIPSSVYKLCLNFDNPDSPYIERLAQWPNSSSQNDSGKQSGQKAASPYETFRQINVNSLGEVFVAAVTSGAVLKLDNDLTQCQARYSNNIGAPWGITFDQNDFMYVANFFPLHESPADEGELDVRGDFGVTVIRFDNEDGAQIMTLPTGGAPVMLANGYELYGSGNPSSYQPLSRLTGTGIDRVGNLWALNNWKPSAYVDFEANPGGDGVVIFIGVAAPNPQD